MNLSAFLARLTVADLLSERAEARREMDTYLPSEYAGAGFLRAQTLYLACTTELERRGAFVPSLAA